MSRIVRITEPAQQDLEEIWQGLEPFGLEVADQSLNELQKKFLNCNSSLGWDDRGRIWRWDLRSVVVRDVVVLYRSIEGLIVIVRVIHGRRDLKRTLTEE